MTCLPGEAHHIFLVAPNVEDKQDVPALHIQQVLGPGVGLPVDQMHARADRP